MVGVRPDSTNRSRDKHRGHGSTMRIPRQPDLGRLTCFATAGGPPCSPAQWLALRSGSSGEWAGYSHSCLCAVGHQDLFCCRVYPVGRRHSILSSDRLAFDHFKITLIVMVTTATGNRADLHEFLARRRFQSKWDHLQVLVLVAGRRCHWGDLPSALYVDWLSRSKTGPQKRVTKVTNRRSSSACFGSQVYDGFGKRKLGPAPFVRRSPMPTQGTGQDISRTCSSTLLGLPLRRSFRSLPRARHSA